MKKPLDKHTPSAMISLQRELIKAELWLTRYAASRSEHSQTKLRQSLETIARLARAFTKD